MNLSEDDERFLKSRSRFVRAWRHVGTALLGVLAATVAWLYFTKPLLANPSVVADRLRDGSLDTRTLEFMALLLPIVVLAMFFVCAALLLFSFAAFRNEAKYLEIIGRGSGTGEAKPE